MSPQTAGILLAYMTLAAVMTTGYVIVRRVQR